LYTKGWDVGWTDALSFFTMRAEGKLQGGAEGGDKLGCLEIWVKKRLLESGERGPYAWEHVGARGSNTLHISHICYVFRIYKVRVMHGGTLADEKHVHIRKREAAPAPPRPAPPAATSHHVRGRRAAIGWGCQARQQPTRSSRKLTRQELDAHEEMASEDCRRSNWVSYQDEARGHEEDADGVIYLGGSRRRFPAIYTYTRDIRRIHHDHHHNTSLYIGDIPPSHDHPGYLDT
jgi:hypothetical protein